MKRKEIIHSLLKEGFTEKFLSKLTDRQITDLSERVLSEEVLGDEYLYSALIGFVIELSDAGGSDKSIEELATFSELRMYYESLRDGKKPKPLSRMANRAMEWVEKTIVTLPAAQIAQLAKDGKGVRTISSTTTNVNLNEEVLNIPKDDQASIEKAKSDNKQFVTYEEESGEVEVVKNTKKSTKNSKKEMKEWVEGIVKKNYHPEVTTKKEIYEMIGSLSDSADNLVDAKNMFSVDEQSPSPSKPDTDAPVREKPTTKPNKPRRENPFQPKHQPKPKAKLPKSLEFKTLMSLNERRS